MSNARFDIPTQLPAGVTRPLYAGVGATDRVVEVVREAVADVQKRALAVQKDVQRSAAGFDYQPQALRQQAGQAVLDLQAEAKQFPVRLQKLVDDQVATTYNELVKRGETLVDRIRRQPSTTDATSSAKTTTTKAKTTRTQAGKSAAAAKRSTTRTTKKAAKSPARSSAKATTTAAKKTASSSARATTDAARKVGN